MCTFNDLVFSNNTLEARWEINHIPHGINSLHNGLVPGYSANVNNANIIVKNIMMNDSRSGTEYRCMLFNKMGTRLDESYPIILRVVGEYQYNMYTVIFNSISRVCICSIYCYRINCVTEYRLFIQGGIQRNNTERTKVH